MTVTVDLPDDLAARLSADAREQGRELAAVVVDTLAAAYSEDVDEETLEAIGRGLVQMDADQSFTLDEIRAHTDAVLAARSTKPGV